MTYETDTITGKLFEDKTFSFPIRVYYEDTDAGGIVYYANYLKFAERARTEYLRHIGFSQDELLKNQGVGFVVRECHIRYKTPAKLDDALNITCKVTEMKGASLKMEQKLYRGETILAEVEVSLVFLSIHTMRPTKIPQEITSIF
ncbi:MAG: tol-pal system-associated acyl-CoA thioesterase [Alphaproteobacteria bacterium]|nr:tol-pal system-associated acyl-CoA thioesterase [Alphaproteobacteria bacterium]